MPAQPEPTDRAEVHKLATAVEEALGEAMQTRYLNPDLPSWEDGARIGDAPPVKQPDSRIVPAWAAGIAVASIGVGAGITGVGCGAWLAINALASVTLNGVLMVTLPFAGIAMVFTAIGGLINKAKQATPDEIHNHYEGPVFQDQRNVHSRTSGVWAKTNNQQ